MAATTEEQEPPSPSIFLNHGNGDTSSQQPRDDLTMDCISRMLMEEDIVDKFLYQYPDQLALQQTLQPFAQILSASGTKSNLASDAQESPAPDMLASALLPSNGSSTHIRNPFFLLNSLSPSKGSTSMHMLSSKAFFKGMEEANKFLPRDNRAVDGRGRKNRFDDNGEMEQEMGRSSKQKAVLVQLDWDEDAEAIEMFDKLMLSGYNISPDEMREVGITIDGENEAERRRKTPRGRRGKRQPVVADLETLLIRCAEAVATNNRHSANQLLERIRRHSSPTGDASQRLAHYFAQGLEARLAGTGSQFYRSFMANTPAVDRLKAYKLFMATCCFLKVSFIFSNKTIYKAAAGRKKLHIVHYGVNDGFQWPELLRWLADREGGPPEVRMTCISSTQPGFTPMGRHEDIGCRMSYCASQLGVPFKFRAITAKSQTVRAEDLDIHPDELLVVNSLFHLRTLMDETVVVDRINPRDQVLSNIKKMKPSVFINAVVNGSYSTAFFMTRFRQALHNYTAHFDVLETTVPRDNGDRLLVEREVIARSAINMIACEGADRVERPQNYREWQARIQRAGLRQLPLDPEIVQLLRGDVKNNSHKHFVINEDDRWVLQGWKGRVLYALSTWTDAR